MGQPGEDGVRIRGAAGADRLGDHRQGVVGQGRAGGGLGAEPAAVAGDERTGLPLSSARRPGIEKIGADDLRTFPRVDGVAPGVGPQESRGDLQPSCFSGMELHELGEVGHEENFGTAVLDPEQLLLHHEIVFSEGFDSYHLSSERLKRPDEDLVHMNAVEAGGVDQSCRPPRPEVVVSKLRQDLPLKCVAEGHSEHVAFAGGGLRVGGRGADQRNPMALSDPRHRDGGLAARQAHQRHGPVAVDQLQRLAESRFGTVLGILDDQLDLLLAIADLDPAHSVDLGRRQGRAMGHRRIAIERREHSDHHLAGGLLGVGTAV